MLCWCNNKLTFQGEDIQEFDFIPFGFSMGNNMNLFINNNFSIKSLISSNNHFNKDYNEFISLYKYLVKIYETGIDNNIEIIIKNTEKDYFETLYIQKDIIEKLHRIQNIEKINELEKLNIQVRNKFCIDMNYILKLIFNRQNLDSIIYIMLKEKDIKKDRILEKYNYYLPFIIKINMILKEKGLHNMTEKYKSVYACAKNISDKLEDNKLNTYRTKLTAALISNNKEGVYNILLQLSNYTNTNISFMFDILDDYENNKDQIYSFISALTKTTNVTKKEVKNND